MKKYGHGIRKVTTLMGLVLVVLLAGYASTIAAPAKPYYAGKILKILVSGPPGGGYDSYARLLIRYLPKYLPGNPTAIVENMQGTFKLENLFFSKTKPDGYTIAVIFRGRVIGQLVESPGALFDFKKFRSIGSMDTATQGIYVRADSSIRTIDDLRKAKPPLITSFAERGGNVDLSSTTPFLLELMGFSVKVPRGGSLTSNAEHMLAFERKEIDIFSTDYTSLLTSRRHWLEGKYIRFMMSNGACKVPSHPLLDPLTKGVPCWTEVATDPKIKMMLKVWSNFSLSGRPFYAPPGTPDDVLEMLRRAFDKAMQDPDLLREAEKMGLTTDPMRGEEVQRLQEEIVDLKKTDPAVTKIIRDVFGVKS